ncbi:MAG TPA: Hsp20/alpha crystallin family protein [Vicinamibacteria bacterium]|nr:Hsp20/alpha crystallin family protein [Vicinamibacteria bacterium]
MVQRRGALPEVSSLSSLQREFSKIFDQLTQLDTSDAGGVGLGEWFPRVDVLETAKEVMVKVEAPGLARNEIEVSFQGPKLVLSGEKKQPKVDRSVRGYLCLERSFGKFSRSLYIDRAVDLTKAKAELESGVLTVTIPKLKDRRGSAFRLDVEEVELKTK